MTTALDIIDRFYDDLPRGMARVEHHGPLVVFVREDEGWPFCARPRLGAAEPPTAADVDRVRARQRQLGIPESLAWIAETAPELRAATEKSGLVVHEHPLMELGACPPPGPPPDGVDVRVLGFDDPTLPTALAVPHLAFATPGTGVGIAGSAELEAAARVHATPAAQARAVVRIASGDAGWAAAVDNTTGIALCSGQYSRVDDVCEISSVGTLPSARRRGLALAVTAALATEARSRGIRTVFLAAGDPDVARIYARIGFRRVGTALIAGPLEA